MNWACPTLNYFGPLPISLSGTPSGNGARLPDTAPRRGTPGHGTGSRPQLAGPGPAVPLPRHDRRGVEGGLAENGAPLLTGGAYSIVYIPPEEPAQPEPTDPARIGVTFSAEQIEVAERDRCSSGLLTIQ